MNKLVKRLLTGTLAFATILTALPVTAVHASGNQYWTESAERVGYIEHVMNDGSIKSTFNEGHMKVEGETAYCVDINTSFKNGYKTRSDASSRMSSDQIADVALSLEYVKQYTASHTNLNYKQGYLLEQCVVWQRLSEQLGWQCDNVRASYNEISQAVQNEVYAGAKAFVKANKGRYECGGYIYTGEGQDIGQFWAKLNVGNAKVKKTSSNPTVTDGNANYSFEGATFGVYSDKGCNSQLATLTADGNGDTKEVEVKAGTVYIKELSAPKGYKLDSTVHALNVEVGKTATLTVADTPKVTEALIDLFKIDMETGKSTPQGTASLEGAEFTWSYYDGYYNADNLPAKATRTWTTKTVAEKDSDGIHTTATDKKTGEKMIVAGKDIKIVDKVTLDGLEAGTKYKLSGWQMLKEENAELLIDGKRVDSNYTFTADSEKMTVEITYSFDGSALGGKNLVTFEELYDISNPKEPVKVAEHKDINDDGQTVLITERIIKIHTTATDKNGKKEIEAGKDVTIVDKVTLDGLEVGTKYKLSGWQMLKEENAELLIDGKKVSNDYEFTADNEKMTVEIAFTFDGSSLGGKSLVTFEELYDMTNPDEPKKVTEHKDITDDGQTVTIKEVPEVPDTPKDTDTPDTPSMVTKTSDSPKTGDNTNIYAYLAMLGLSCVGLGGMLYFKRRKKKS